MMPLNRASKSGIKGTLDIEFMVSVLVFLTAISFVSISVINNIPKLHQESFSQDLKSKSFQISELLMFDAGEPPGWGGVSQAKRLGLSNGTKYYLSSAKISALNAYCNDAVNKAANYDKIKDLLGLDFTNDIIIDIKDLSSVSKLACGPEATSTIRPKATITRIGVDTQSSSILMMMVSVI